MTSLKWIGPSLGDLEAVPKIPPQLEYGEVVKRSDDIGFSDGKGSPQSVSREDGHNETSHSDRDQSSIRSGEANSSLENSTPSQDVADRQRLQMMMQVSKSATWS